MKRERDASELAGAARRMIRALGRRVGGEDPIDLCIIAALRVDLEEAYLAAMRAQHEAGFSYAEIAAGVGKTRQSVAQRLGAAAGDDVA